MSTDEVNHTETQARVRWRNPDFNRFWSAHAISTFGTSFTTLAIPLVAVLVLNLNTFRIGLLATAAVLPIVVLGPFFGVFVDRHSRKSVMIWCDLGRAALVGTIPLLVLLDALNFASLVVISGSVAVLSSIFNLAHESCLPDILAEEHLSYGNSRLEATESAAEIGGPGIAGWLVGAFSASAAVIFDAVTYVISAALLVGVRIDHSAETPQKTSDNEREERNGMWAEARVGFRILWNDPVLRPVAVSYAALVLFAQLQMAIYVVFLVREIHLSPQVIGLIFSASAIVGLLSAILAGRLTSRHGAGPLTVVGQALTVVGAVLLALVAGGPWQAGLTMLLAECFFAMGMSLYGVGSRTLNQVRTSSDTRGRVLGASRTLTGYAAAAAGLLGGTIATTLNLRAALVAGAVGMVLSLLLVIRPEVWKVKGDQPQPS